MEEMYGAVAVPFRVGNLIFDNLSGESCMDVMNFKLMAGQESSFPETLTKSSGNSGNGDDEDCILGDSGSEVGLSVSLGSAETRSGVSSVLAMTSEDESNWLAAETVVRESEEDGSSSLEGDRILDSSCSLSVVSDTSSLCGDDLLAFETNSEVGTQFLDVEKSICDAKPIPETRDLEKLIEGTVLGESLSVAVGTRHEIAGGVSTKSSEADVQLDKGLSGKASRSVFEVDYVPLWGFISVCGRRPEMEDAVATVPRFMRIPIQMLIGDRVIDGVTSCLSHLTGHFFGVYDGHGGSQVDDEIGGRARLEPVAPETVGSTAVVAIVCSSHIIVANCGDSRAVLCRGKQPMALSVDHKPNREDEYARIEAAGGKVIQWNGHRVFGVLAMSRSIASNPVPPFPQPQVEDGKKDAMNISGGDRYLKPWIIPDPEVQETRGRMPHLDGPNEEVCDMARKRILLWHKNNGVTLREGEGIDPAAQAAAEYLSNRALQKGSKDNISVVVVDLKAQRKIKSRT
ncbi:UNVERIFIED_CONTAM: putative protein phosphatase 2C 6 [Sesamum calycinum]|uniref:protein-serine/threonine phosphatase n=1 Tax=Sesamum calycinum TaxID=2727403 RepID=A0AAW2LWY6_9LAMI